MKRAIFLLPLATLAICLSSPSARADIVNGTVDDPSITTVTSGWLLYQHVGSGSYHANDVDSDGLAGTADIGWSLGGTTFDKDGTAGNDRGGAAWFIDDVSGTGWTFEYDFSGTTNGSTTINLYLGLDDGNNGATTRVMGFGSTAGRRSVARGQVRKT